MLSSLPIYKRTLGTLAIVLCLGQPAVASSDKQITSATAKTPGSAKSAGSAKTADSTKTADSIKNNATARNSAPELTSKTVRRKIVSLAPSNTELIYSVGGEQLLEGVSTFCEYPPAVKAKPRVGSFVSVNLEKLTLLKPDLVLLVSGQEALAIQLKKRRIATKVLRNASLSDIAVNLEEIGQICSRQKEAKVLADKYLDSLRTLNLILAGSKPTKVFFCVWPGPVITVGGGSFLNDVITKCGGSNIASSIKGTYPRFGAERLVASNPELIILPFEAQGTGLLKKTPWSLLRAIKTKKYYFLPDREHDYLSRPTLRIIAGLQWLSSKLHPEKAADLTAWEKSANR